MLRGLPRDQQLVQEDSAWRSTLTTHITLIVQTNPGARRTPQAEALRGCRSATMTGSVSPGLERTIKHCELDMAKYNEGCQTVAVSFVRRSVSELLHRYEARAPLLTFHRLTAATDQDRQPSTFAALPTELSHQVSSIGAESLLLAINTRPMSTTTTSSDFLRACSLVSKASSECSLEQLAKSSHAKSALTPKVVRLSES